MTRRCAAAILASLAVSSAGTADGSTCDAGSAACIVGLEDEASLLQARVRGGQSGEAELGIEESRADEPNPPDFGSNVYVVEPGEGANYYAEWNKMYEQWKGWDNEAQFGDHRTAVLLKPGAHNVDINLPYYFSVIGLGERPSDTTVKPGSAKYGLRVDTQGNPNSDNTFWRSIENVHLQYSPVKFWVSQAAPMRSVIVDGDLQLADTGNGHWASGGALMNSQISGTTDVGNQQQWYTRGTTMNPYQRVAGPGSYVCVGCVHAGSERPYDDSYDWKNPTKDEFKHTGASYTDAPAAFAEKPYFHYSSGKYYLQVPGVLTNRWGPTWAGGQKVPFERVYVATSSSTAKTINAKINAGKHIVFPPGIYKLTAPIKVNQPGIVLLGFGFATLIPDYQTTEPLIQVGDVDGVRVAGLLLHAGRSGSAVPAALLKWGSSYAGSVHNPGFIYDVIGRVGGPENYETAVTKMVQINSGNVIGDNLWLWKADHCVGTEWPCVWPKVDTALEVNGDDVKMYGLMAEHTDKDIVVWNGDHGETNFFQCEFRYSMGLKSASPVDPGPAVGYRVTAKNHKAIGFGIYMTMYNPKPSTQWPLVDSPHGFSAMVVKHADTFEWGFKDVNAANWAGNSWPAEGKITCVCWADAEQECLDNKVAQNPR